MGFNSGFKGLMPDCKFSKQCW